MYYFSPEVKVYPGDKEADILNYEDRCFMEGNIRHRPSEFDLHLAIYILETESVPDNLLEPIKEWTRNNKKAGTKIPTLFT